VNNEANMRRLASPFVARTYGPSSSSGEHEFFRPSTPKAQTDSGTTLEAGFSFASRESFPGAPKRRAQHNLEDELSPGGSDVRRNIMDDMLGFPTDTSHRRVRSRGFSLGDVTGTRISTTITPPAMYDRMNNTELTSIATTIDQNTEPIQGDVNMLQPPLEPLQRLGSPFSAVGQSNSVPSRLLEPLEFGAPLIHRTTMQHSRRSIASIGFAPEINDNVPEHENKVSYIGRRLAEIHSRGSNDSMEESERKRLKG
jgi:hypothetical protein